MRNACLRTIIGLLVFVSAAAAHAQEPPSADHVFRLRVSPGAAGALVLNWTIAPGNYLYRDKIAAAGAGGSPIEVSTDSGEIKDDPSFGETEIYRDRAQAVVAAKLLPQDGDIVVTFQGCAERGICYPPVKKTVDPRTMSVVGGSAKSELTSSSGTDPVQDATFQGCAERGICYPPVKKTVDPRTMSVVGGSAKSELTSSSGTDPVQDA